MSIPSTLLVYDPAAVACTWSALCYTPVSRNDVVAGSILGAVFPIQPLFWEGCFSPMSRAVRNPGLVLAGWFIFGIDLGWRLWVFVWGILEFWLRLPAGPWYANFCSSLIRARSIFGNGSVGVFESSYGGNMRLCFVCMLLDYGFLLGYKTPIAVVLFLEPVIILDYLPRFCSHLCDPGFKTRVHTFKTGNLGFLTLNHFPRSRCPFLHFRCHSIC